jgi:hypothetical protein
MSTIVLMGGGREVTYSRTVCRIILKELEDLAWDVVVF